MAGRWRTCLSLLFLGLAAPTLVAAEHSFENTAVVRTVELGGSLVHVTTTYAVRALEDGSSIYTIALGEKEQEKTSWIQAKMKGQVVPLDLEHFGFSPKTYVASNIWHLCPTYIADLPQRCLSICRRVSEDPEGEWYCEPGRGDRPNTRNIPLAG